MKWNKINESYNDVQEYKIRATGSDILTLLSALRDAKRGWEAARSSENVDSLDMIIQQIKKQVKNANTIYANRG